MSDERLYQYQESTTPKKDVLTGPHCPHCGTQGPSGAKFCYECGGKIKMATLETTRSAADKKQLFKPAYIDMDKIEEVLIYLLRNDSAYSQYDYYFEDKISKNPILHTWADKFNSGDNSPAKIIKKLIRFTGLNLLEKLTANQPDFYNKKAYQVITETTWITPEVISRVASELETGEKEADILDIARLYEETANLLPSKGIPPELNRLIEDNLSQLDIFYSPEKLRYLFNDQRLHYVLKRGRLSFNNNNLDNIGSIINNLARVYSRNDNRNALVVFLEVLYEDPIYGPQLEKDKYLLDLDYLKNISGIRKKGKANNQRWAAYNTAPAPQSTTTWTRPANQVETQVTPQWQEPVPTQPRETTSETSDNFLSLAELKAQRFEELRDKLIKLASRHLMSDTLPLVFVDARIVRFRNHLEPGGSLFKRVEANLRELFLNEDLIKRVNADHNVNESPTKFLYDFILILAGRIDKGDINRQKLIDLANSLIR